MKQLGAVLYQWAILDFPAQWALLTAMAVAQLLNYDYLRLDMLLAADQLLKQNSAKIAKKCIKGEQKGWWGYQRQR